MWSSCGRSTRHAKHAITRNLPQKKFKFMKGRLKKMQGRNANGHQKWLPQIVVLALKWEMRQPAIKSTKLLTLSQMMTMMVSSYVDSSYVWGPSPSLLTTTWNIQAYYKFYGHARIVSNEGNIEDIINGGHQKQQLTACGQGSSTLKAIVGVPDRRVAEWHGPWQLLDRLWDIARGLRKVNSSGQWETMSGDSGRTSQEVGIALGKVWVLTAGEIVGECLGTVSGEWWAVIRRHLGAVGCGNGVADHY